MARTEKPGLQSERVRASQTKSGKELLQDMAASLQARGVPASSYIVIDVIAGEFVTGKTPEEARLRFELLHPGVKGWMQRFSDVIGGPEELPDTAESAAGGGRGTAMLRDRRFTRRPS